MKSPDTIHWPFLIGLAFLKIILTIVLIHPEYGFHRDEFLYLALGNHLDFGYWSNPPFIGLVSFISQTLLGDSVLATRFIPILTGGGLVILAGLIAKELGGGKYAQILAAIAIIISPAYIRVFSMLQPVPFDVFFWTLAFYAFLKFWNNRSDRKYLLWLGAIIGLGMLNKYSLVFLIAGLAIALIISKDRTLLLEKKTWLAAGLGILVLLPNLIWQVRYNFPVIHHMQELAANQLSNVSLGDFMTDQLLMQFSCLIIWIPGLIFLLFHPTMKSYRVLGYSYLSVMALFLILSGKSYYPLGLYPMLLAAGAVYWERLLKQGILQIALPLVLTGINLLSLPIGTPLWAPEELITFYQNLEANYGLDLGRRWEDGNIHPLPQDFADMLGWEELADLIEQAYLKGTSTGKCAIYCENYGQAGATDFLKKGSGLPPIISLSDTYRIWAPDKLDGYSSFIYVNDELGEDVQALFGSIEMIGQIENQYAREQGTAVYLCMEPKTDFFIFWEERVTMVKESFR